MWIMSRFLLQLPISVFYQTSRTHLHLGEAKSTQGFIETRHFLLDENIYYDTSLLLCLFHMAPCASVALFTLKGLGPRSPAIR